MALATSTLRSAWAPACRDGHALLPMYVGIDAALKKWRYEPHDGTGAANCRPITGGTGYSLHAYFGEAPFTFWNGYRIPLMALALDINPQQNPYGPRLVTDMPRGMIDDITAIRTKSGDQMIGWGGYFTGNRDAMHFQGVCTPSAMATGIDPKTLPQLPTKPIAALLEDDMPLILTADGKGPRLFAPPVFVPLDAPSVTALKKAGVKEAKITPKDHDEIRAQIIKALD